MRRGPLRRFSGPMTDNDTGYAAPPPGYAPQPPATNTPRPPLRRPAGDNVLGGVAAGIARWLGIDPILVRVAFVVLTIIGGSGILLYLAGWVFIPEDGHPDSAGERFFRNNNALAITAAVVVAVIVVSPMLAWGVWDGGVGFGGVVLLLLVIAGVVALTRRDETPASTPGSDASATTAALATMVAAPITTTPAATTETAVLPRAAEPAPLVPLAPPVPPREKSVLGRLTVGLAMLVAGTLIALDMADVISVTAVTVVASALGTVALGLLVGAFVGRSRGLIALGTVLALVLIPLSAIPDDIDWNVGEGVGDRTYRVVTASDLEPEFTLGAGELTIDLRRAELDGSYDIDASLGAGELIVVLPHRLIPVTVDSTVAVGVIEMPTSTPREGADLQASWERPLTQPQLPDDGTPVTSPDAIHLTLSAGFGQVTVIEERAGAYERPGASQSAGTSEGLTQR